jgi:IS1 family transposase
MPECSSKINAKIDKRIDMRERLRNMSIMNRLDPALRSQILRCLVEGNSIRATGRLCGVEKRTVTRLLIDAGRACQAFQDRELNDLPCKRVQVDEIWSFVYSKQKNVKAAKAAPDGAGDAWTWTAICADTKLAINWLVGERNAVYAHAFIHDVWERLAGRVQLTSDGHATYRDAVEQVFGIDVDYGQLVKTYGPSPEGEKRYSPAECIGAKKVVITGNPDKKHISTSFVERQNLTMRMAMRRFTRLTNAFSKKLENHAYAVSLHFMNYNFCRVHQSLRVTPAMAAGVTDRVWDVDDIISLVEQMTPAPKARGPYKKRQST